MPMVRKCPEILVSYLRLLMCLKRIFSWFLWPTVRDQKLLLNTVSDQGKSSSLVVIFSVWKTMVGTAVLSLPWAFELAGIGLGLIISLVSFLISFYTCKLIVDQAGNDADYSITLKKYYGKSVFDCIFFRQGGILHRPNCSGSTYSGCRCCILRNHVQCALSYTFGYLRMVLWLIPRISA